MPPATVRALGQPRLAGLHRQPRLAGLHRQPRRDALARAGHRARPPRQQSGPAGARPLAVRPWTLTALAARSALVLIRAFARIARARDNACVCAGHRRCLAEHIPGACYAELATTGCVPWACAAGIAGEAGEFLTGTRHVPASHRPLAAVLFTDIVGSTQQAALLGDRAWKGRLDQHDEIAERQIPALRRAVREEHRRRHPGNLRRPRPGHPLRSRSPRCTPPARPGRPSRSSRRRDRASRRRRGRDRGSYRPTGLQRRRTWRRPGVQDDRRSRGR